MDKGVSQKIWIPSTTVLSPVASFTWQENRQDSDTIGVAFSDSYVDIQLHRSDQTDVCPLNDALNLIRQGKTQRTGMSWVRGRSFEIVGLDRPTVRSVFGVGTKDEILKAVHGSIRRELENVTEFVFSGDLLDGIYKRISLMFLGAKSTTNGFFAVSTGLRGMPPSQMRHRLKMKQVKGGGLRNVSEGDLIFDPSSFGYPDIEDKSVPVYERKIWYLVREVGTKNIGYICQGGRGKTDPSDAWTLAKGALFAAYSDTTVLDENGKPLLIENPFVRFGMEYTSSAGEKRVYMEDFGFSLYGDRFFIAVHGWNDYPKFAHDILQRDFELGLQIHKLIEATKKGRPSTFFDKGAIFVTPLQMAKDDEEPELRRPFGKIVEPRTVIDPSQDVADLKAEIIKPFSLADSHKIQQVIFYAQTHAPSNKEQFAKDINLLLFVSNNAIWLKDGSQVKLWVNPSNGSIQFQVIGGNRGNRGFISTSFDMRLDSPSDDTSIGDDDASRLASQLRVKMIKPFSKTDIRKLEQIINNARLCTPSNKEQFAKDINLMLKISHHTIQLQDGTVGKLGVDPSSEFLHLRVTRGNGRNRGFVRSPLQIIPS